MLIAGGQLVKKQTKMPFLASEIKNRYVCAPFIFFENGKKNSKDFISITKNKFYAALKKI